jgi:hypothetical protein
MTDTYTLSEQIMLGNVKKEVNICSLFLSLIDFRLGDPDKAIHHYKQSAKEATSTDISRAQSVKNRIAKCNEARKLKDWVGVTKEAQSAIIDGADSAPQVLSLKLGKREKKRVI